jgi:translation initiation factor IF-2
MEQRPLRLGDIVDDYCPRERRVTNHAIVALVDETIKQTRCTTCDHEHVYKQAREPRRRKKDDPGTLYTQVLSGLQKTPGMPASPEIPDMEDEIDAPAVPAETAEPVPAPVAAPVAPAAPVAAAAPAAVAPPAPDGEPAQDEDQDEANGNVLSDDEPWSMHRRLIRAQLPRTGNEPPPARPLPDFTIRQPGSRAGQRPWGRGGGEPNGNTPGRHGRGGQGQGQGQGGGQNRPGGRGGGGRFAQGGRPDGPRRGGQGQGGGGGRPGGGRGRRSR